MAVGRDVPAPEATNSSCGRLCDTCEEFCVPWNSHFFAMLKDCGHTCKLIADGENVVQGPGKFVDEIRKKLDCQKLWLSPHMDVPGEGELPPKLHELPGPLREMYSYGGLVDLKDNYMNSKYYGSKKDVSGLKHHWTKEMIEELVSEAHEHKLRGTYGFNETQCLEAGLKDADLRGKKVLVIGSERPWVEALCLEHGASEVTTLEYASLVSSHDRVHTITPPKMAAAMEKDVPPSFDAIVTFSSVEHSGLGRYGDALNPFGDLITMARAWCVAKPGANLVLGVMSEGIGKRRSKILFNAHRSYGRVTYAQLLANWKQETFHKCGQSVFTSTKLPAL
ncbi:unnamed protein product [Symbiodinium necroappetens]|uniref:Uncharacterized protein n=1 Tax=Symbiodinium necroappetens TaxID=1628268 RepID=A0A813BI04_9DINO|nr:unnamed protein product [Symbiodinium necroappetens]